MLYAEYDPEVEMRVVREEALEEGREQGLEEGMGIGREEGMELAARNALTKGISVQTVQEITGLPLEKIKEISIRNN